MPFLHPMAPDALVRKDGRPASPIQPDSPVQPTGPAPVPPSYAWAPEDGWAPEAPDVDTPDVPPIPPQEDPEEDEEDAVPTAQMPTPVCVPAFSIPATGPRHSRAWLLFPAALLVGVLIGYLLYRLGLRPAIVQWLDTLGNAIGGFFRRIFG